MYPVYTFICYEDFVLIFVIMVELFTFLEFYRDVFLTVISIYL